MKTLVTGGAGFLGAHIVRQLMERGEEIVILDIDLEHAPEGARSVEGSVTDPGALARAMTGCEAVIHAAAIAQLWARDKSAFERVNVAGARATLEAARAAGVKRFVHVSSAVTLVGANTPRRGVILDESAPTSEAQMLGPYPRSKWRAEQTALAANAPGFEVVSVLPTVPIGPGDRHLTAPAQMICDFANGATPAALETVLNFIDVRDCAGAAIAARDKGEAGARYLLAGHDVTMTAFLALLERLTGRAQPKMRVPYALAWLAGAVETFLADHVTKSPPKASLTGVRLAGRAAGFSNARARAQLGAAIRPLEETLADALADLRARGLVD